MKLKFFVSLAFGVALSACGGDKSASAPPKPTPPVAKPSPTPTPPPYAAGPNVVFIIADDMNNFIGEVGRHPQVLAPNLARLAKRGVTFTNAHANATICSPSRASFLSGYAPSTSNKYQNHLDLRKHPVLAEAKLIPEHFRDNGYAAYVAGKVFHPGEEDYTVLGTAASSSQPAARNDRSKGFVGPGHSYGPYPWDGVFKLEGRPSRLIPYGTEGVDWAYRPNWSIEIDENGRWNSNPDFPKSLQHWANGFGRMSAPPRFDATMNSRYPAGHSYSGFAYEGGALEYSETGPRSDVPDEETARWASELLRGIKPSNGRYSATPPIGQNSFIMLLGLQKTHMPLYMPDQYFDDVIDHAGIQSIDDVQLPELYENRLGQSDLDDVPMASSVGIGKRAFRQWMEAGRETDVFPDMVHAGQWIELTENRMFKSLVLSYLSAIYEVDVQVGRIIDAIDADPRLRDNTIIVFTSDHGFHLGEKGLFGKGTLWDESTNVPLIIVDPREEFASSRGKRSNVPVSLVDVYPTLAGLADIPSVPIAQGNPALDGISLEPILRNPDNPALAREPFAISSTFGNTNDAVAPNPNLRNHSIRSAEWRYTLNKDGSEELYNLVKDPEEWDNLASEPNYAWAIEMLRPWLFSQTGRGE